MSLFSHISWLGPQSAPPSSWVEALQAAPPWRGLERSAFRVFESRTTPFTSVHGFETNAGAVAGRRYWLKVYRREPDAAGQEFSFLRDAAARVTGAAGLEVARPVAWLPAIGGIVTAHIEGRPLAALLADPAVPPDRKEQLCRRAGALLARIHGPVTPVEGERFEFAPVLDAIRRELEDFPSEARKRLCDRLEPLAARLAPTECELRPGHGDYAPFNLMVTPQGLAAFDPSFHRAFSRPGNRSTPAEDLARFAATLRGIWPGTFAAPDRRHLQVVFFSAYREAGGPAFSPESPSFRVLFTYFLLRGLRDWGGLRLRLGGGPARATVFRLWLDELIDAPLIPS